jgi:hypothetical protein
VEAKGGGEITGQGHAVCSEQNVFWLQVIVDNRSAMQARHFPDDLPENTAACSLRESVARCGQPRTRYAACISFMSIAS